MASVVGERGLWLAAQNRSWRWVLDHAPDAPDAVEADVDLDGLRRTFMDGRLDDRVLALCRLREADPAGSRELLEGGWAGEQAGDRGLLLSTLTVGLSAADEPFLVLAAADLGSRVRSEARALLERVEGSALNRRFAARAAAILTLVEDEPAPRRRSFLADLLRGNRPVAPTLRLHVNLPEDLPEDWSTDGVYDEVKPGIGRRTSWAIQVISRVHPEAWAGPNADPGRTIRLFAEDDWPLLLAVSRSVVERRLRDWAAALWDYWRGLTVGEQARDIYASQLPGELAPLLAPDHLAAHVMGLLREGVRGASGDWQALMAAWPGSWPEDLAGIWLAGLRLRIIRSASASMGEDDGLLAWQRSVGLGARKLPLSMLDGRVPRLPDPAGSGYAARRWRSVLEIFNDQLAARIGLQRDLDGLPPAPLAPLAPPDGESP
jgi:hypothetical protein